MNLKKSGKMLWIVAAVAMLAMVLQGCGGDDGVSPSTHMDVEDERDMYKAEAERLQGELNTANADLTAANMRIGSADDADSLLGMLAAATAQIGSADDPDSLMGMLAAERANVMTLTQQIDGDGTPDNPGLTAQLADAMMRIGEAPGPDGMGGSGLLGDLATAMARIGTEPGPDGMGGSGLLGDLAAEMAKVTMYMEMIDGDGTDANPGLKQQLADARARIAALEGGTAPDVLDPIKQAASDAADDANDAYTAADTAAGEAETAAMNRATIQTGDANSVADAYMARMQANAAKDAAESAKAHSDLAQAAMNVADATPHKDQAEDARDDAMEAQTMAEGARDEAVMDATMEVKIHGSTKSVGDTSITINRQSRTSADGRTITGLLSGMNITQTGLRDANGHLVVDAGGNAVSGVGATAMVDIGVTYDSADDDARVTLVHSYLGTAKEMQFIRGGGTASTVTDSPFGAVPTATALTPEPPDPADTPDTIPTGFVEVEYAQANAALGLSGDSALAAPTTPTTTRTATGVAGMPRPAGIVAKAFDDLEGTQPTLYYIDTGVADISVGADDDGIDQTRIFLERRVIANAVQYDLVFVRQVTVDSAMAFEHIHYGLWNGISGMDANTVADLGIGFVTALADGGGMTAVDDMPNVGTVTYNGNWVANVQRAAIRGDGDIVRQDGMATIMANVEKNEVDVTLTNLATLEGMIDGNMFSGTKVTLADSNTTLDGIQAMYGLDGAGKFEGSFSGGFFGPRAAEAGGVFDFSSEDNHEGAFRGSFGGGR